MLDDCCQMLANAIGFHRVDAYENDNPIKVNARLIPWSSDGSDEDKEEEEEEQFRGALWIQGQEESVKIRGIWYPGEKEVIDQPREYASLLSRDVVFSEFRA